MKIDFVVTWVDNTDPHWLNERAKFSPKNIKMNEENRYRDFGFFKYWFRAVEKYAPWVNKVYLITSGHLPEWINLDHEKLVHIRHEDYIPREYLPTFNSNVIELNLHRIEDLSEHFVLFNDDVFINSPVNPKDFFFNGLPRDYGIYSVVVPHRNHSNITFNNVKVINNHFVKRETLKKNWRKYLYIGYRMQIFRTLLTLPWMKVTGYYNPHLTASFLKSSFYEVWEKEKGLDETSKNKFRTLSDLNQWLIRYWQIEEGNFMPQRVNFGKYIEIDEYEKLIKYMGNRKYKVLCINDSSDMSKEVLKDKIDSKFEEFFKEKSKYEL